MVAASRSRSTTSQRSVSKPASSQARFRLLPETSSYLTSSFGRTVAGVITPRSLTLSTSCIISSSSLTLKGWPGKSSISSRGISRILLSLASSRSSCVVNSSSSVGRVKSLFLPAICGHLLCELSISLCNWAARLILFDVPVECVFCFQGS